MCWHATFQLSFLFYSLCPLLAAAAAVSCRLYHTVPQALELSTLWQPRYNSSRKASLCRPLLTTCIDLAMTCVCCVCYGHACRGVCGSVELFVFYLPCCCCRIMSSVSRRASSSRALYFVEAMVQQQSYGKCVLTAYLRVMCV